MPPLPLRSDAAQERVAPPASNFAGVLCIPKVACCLLRRPGLLLPNPTDCRQCNMPEPHRASEEGAPQPASQELGNHAFRLLLAVAAAKALRRVGADTPPFFYGYILQQGQA